MDYSLFDDLHFKEVFVGVGIDNLFDEIKSAEDYTIALFEANEGHIIWITDDESAGHSVFITEKRINTQKLQAIFMQKKTSGFSTLEKLM